MCGVKPSSARASLSARASITAAHATATTTATTTTPAAATAARTTITVAPAQALCYAHIFASFHPCIMPSKRRSPCSMVIGPGLASRA